VELHLNLDRDDCVDSDQKTQACQKMLKNGLRALTVFISTIRGPAGIDSFVFHLLRSATKKTRLVRVCAESRYSLPYATDFCLRQKEGKLWVCERGSGPRETRVERHVMRGVHRVDVTHMMDE